MDNSKYRHTRGCILLHRQSQVGNIRSTMRTMPTVRQEKKTLVMSNQTRKSRSRVILLTCVVQRKKDETEIDGSSSTAEHVDNIRPSHFRRKPLRRSACWFYADGSCRSGDNCHFSHDGPLNRKGKARARRDSARARALSSWNSGLSEDSDMKEETRIQI